MSPWAKEIATLDPKVDFERITYLLSVYEFSWDIEKALEFALFRTYAVPSISNLLSRTGELRLRTQKRYDDTELLLAEVSENGLASDNGDRAISRMNEMHARYRISNDDMLYVLSTFAVQPVRWLERFGKRAMSLNEIEASVHYYRALGEKMGIKDVPESFAAFETYQDTYENAHFCFAESNNEIGAVTRDLLLSMYLPKFLVPMARPAIYAFCDPALRQAMGFSHPPRWLERSLIVALKMRGKVLRLLPPRKRPRLLTKRKRATYPTGYKIGELGTFK